MKIFTSHLRPGKPPVLVREGFSLWAALFGWLWFLVHRAWIPAILFFALALLAASASRAIGVPFPALGLMLLQGLTARDLQRWALARRAYLEGPIVAGADEDTALARLLDFRPDLQNTLAAA